jgi:hypothetical protein
MTADAIQKEADKANVKFLLAKQIRQILDEAAKAYGRKEWDADDVETDIDQLVFGD